MDSLHAQLYDEATFSLSLSLVDDPVDSKEGHVGLRVELVIFRHFGQRHIGQTRVQFLHGRVLNKVPASDRHQHVPFSFEVSRIKATIATNDDSLEHAVLGQFNFALDVAVVSAADEGQLVGAQDR